MGFAAEMKYNRQLRRYLTNQFTEPGDDFAKMLITEVYQGKIITQKVRDQFMPVVQRAMQQFISDQVNERLRTALSRESADGLAAVAPSPGPTKAISAPEAAAAAAAAAAASDDVTTVEEIEGLLIVKSVLRGTVAPSRVTMRDQSSYCGILLDNNNRKPLCRLWFNGSRKSVSLFDVLDDGGKVMEQKVSVETLDDLYGLADRLTATATRYDQSKG